MGTPLHSDDQRCQPLKLLGCFISKAVSVGLIRPSGTDWSRVVHGLAHSRCTVQRRTSI
ncbi:uncharacterized protein METZ01_LOCUS86757 [marine metagenome]|uniref:Uncharacterized protein n=1 Tax=marine metagenome TaxID=408172 RepID=A0A381V3R1_9ZZZZ